MRALLATADATARSLATAALADLGHEVLVAEDGRTAWEAFQREPVTLAVLDAGLRDVDGLEVCRRIRAHEQGRKTFVLVIDAHDGRDDLTNVLAAGADDYVLRPSSPENLRARLEIAKRRIAQDEAHRTAEAELARSRWLAGIGETTMALEHEINNPLSALLGHAELLMMDPAVTGEQREQLLVIQEQAARIAQVVRRLAKLKNPQSVEYLAGSLMLDLSPPPGRSE
jgi:DNA-binding response OmpR family regulator